MPKRKMKRPARMERFTQLSTHRGKGFCEYAAVPADYRKVPCVLLFKMKAELNLLLKSTVFTMCVAGKLPCKPKMYRLMACV